VKKGNGDTSTDLSVQRGGGGGGGGATSDVTYGGAPGGGGAGGASISLLSSGDIVLRGPVTTTGGGGGAGGMGRKMGQGSSGGGGAGGGIAIRGGKVEMGADVSAQGRAQDTLGSSNGGTVKIIYTERTGAGAVLAGRTYTNGRPVAGKMLYPQNNSYINAVPVLNWSAAADPDSDPVKYHLMLDNDPSFGSPEVDRSGVAGESLAVPEFTPDGTYYWKVRAEDQWGFGRWSETWKFALDRVAPSSAVAPLPEYTAAPEITLRWSSSDNGSGVSNCTLYVSENGGAWRAFLNRTILNTTAFSGFEGRNYRFYSVAQDCAQNREADPDGPDASTTIDTVAPASSMAALPAYTNTSGFTVSWTGRDDTSGVKSYTVYVSDNEGAFGVWQDAVAERTARFSGTEGHAYRFFVRATDAAGNIEPEPGPEAYAATTVDLSAPKTTLGIGDPQDGRDPVYISPSTPVTLSASDGLSGLEAVYYSVDGGEHQKYTAPITGLPAGHHNITYHGRDNAGNREPDRTLWVFVDGQAPYIRYSIDGNNTTRAGVRYVTPQTKIALECRDNGSGVLSTEYAIDNPEFQTYSGPFTLGGNGPHTLRLRGTDRLGQRGAEQAISFVVDGQPPVTSGSYSLDREAMTATVTFLATDSGSGLAAINYRVLRNGVPPGNWTAGDRYQLTLPQDQSADGNYTVEYYSTDNLGNAEAARSLKFTIDTAAALDMPSGDRSTGKGTYTVTGKAEPGSRVSVNGRQATVAADGTFSIDVELKEGKNTITVVATDKAGNEQTKEFIVTYDKPAGEAIGGMLLPILVVVIIAAAVAGALFFLRGRKGKMVEKPIEAGKTAPAAPEPMPETKPAGEKPTEELEP
jgi:hypothetical protein